MTSIGRIAGGLTVLVGLWLLYIYFYDTIVTSCPANGCEGPQFIPVYSVASPILALVLLGGGGLGIWGAPWAYGLGAILSGIALLLTGYTEVAVAGYGYLSAASNGALVGAILAAFALLGNVVARRSKRGISEQSHPMNLPVFG